MRKRAFVTKGLVKKKYIYIYNPVSPAASRGCRQARFLRHTAIANGEGARGVTRLLC